MRKKRCSVRIRIGFTTATTLMLISRFDRYFMQNAIVTFAVRNFGFSHVGRSLRPFRVTRHHHIPGTGLPRALSPLSGTRVHSRSEYGDGNGHVKGARTASWSQTVPCARSRTPPPPTTVSTPKSRRSTDSTSQRTDQLTDPPRPFRVHG